nr:hypothetical protein [uncultured Draconibacterium sp.]
MKETVEYQAGSALVHDGIKFKVPFLLGSKITLCIKPCLPGTNVRISQKIEQLDKVDVDNPTVQEFMSNGENINHIAGIIATAIVNRKVFRMPLYRFYKWLMLDKVESMEHLYQYFLLVQRQMGPLFFYRIMELTPAMNYLTKRTPTENSKEEKPSGEPSHSSKKPSD